MSSGKSFGGRYAVLERVGTGGMAEVYRARDELLGREVAVKVLSERFSRDRSFIERFRREAQSAANLNHPNIVSLYDFGSDDGTYYIVMEYIDGKSLSELIHEGPVMPERAAEIASDVAQALGRAHAIGLVHRDIKSSNIMLTSRGEIKVTDFGIARLIGGDGEQTMTQTGMVIGTAAYLSPEQAQGNPVDARSDVYSLGVVLYEMLTARTPFGGETPLAIAYKHVREDAPPPSAANPDIPDELDAIVLKAMAKNPDNRYSSAGDMHEDLQRFINGQRVLATPLLADETLVSPMGTGTQVLDQTAVEDYRYAPEERRSPWKYVLIALFVLGALGLLAWLLADQFLGGDVRVPRVIGMDEDEAIAELQNAGLRVQIRDRPHRRAEEGTVFDQDPGEGESVEEGSTVTILVSAGVRQVVVPNLEGLTEDDARGALDEARLELGEVTPAPNEEVEAGLIFDQSPPADSEVDAGTRVAVTVSTGAEEIAVPNVLNQTEEQAVANLDALGFSVEVTREPNEAPEGTVFAQDPEGGTPAVPAETTVVIAVSEGPEEPPMPDVTGEDAEEAEEFLESEYGLDVSLEEEIEECVLPPGTVCRQDPEPNTPISEGDSAVLYVLPE